MPLGYNIPLLITLCLPLLVNSVVPGLWFDRIFIVIFENEQAGPVSSDPNFRNITSQGCSLTQYFAITHPSFPNYIAMVAADYFGIHDDDLHNITGTAPLHLGDLLENAGMSWRSYQEDYPGNCFVSDSYPYMRKHDPFGSFVNVIGNTTRCQNIYPASQLDILSKFTLYYAAVYVLYSQYGK